jgi:hypothetical protein
MDSFFYLGILIIVELTATFFMLKYRRKLPNPLGFVANRIETWLDGYTTRKMSSLIENFAKEPQLIAAMIKKPLELVIEDFLKNPPGGIGKIIGDGVATSSGDVLVDVGQLVLPMFGAKGKKLAQGLALLPLLRGKTKSNDSGKHPFDH